LVAAVVAAVGLFWLAAKIGMSSPNGGSVVRNSLVLMFALAGIAVGVG
jgi:hypothetical protein